MKKIGDSAFSGCTGIRTLVIRSGVESVPQSAFAGCTGITALEIPKSVISIGDSAFSGCTALADVLLPKNTISIGTVAFIMGFYDKFIGSIHDMAFGKMEEKKEAAKYLAKLGIGWAFGMIMAVLLLSALFERHIYVVSSLFFGFVLGSVPLIVEEELYCLRKAPQGFMFAVIGMAAISAMFLPGISGSTLLLIFGAYIPVITAVRGVLSLDISYIPCLAFFGGGILIGAVTVVRVIRVCLQRFRPQMVYMILGMMIGSLYSIGMGPATLDIPQKPLNIGNKEGKAQRKSTSVP